MVGKTYNIEMPGMLAVITKSERSRLGYFGKGTGISVRDGAAGRKPGGQATELSETQRTLHIRKAIIVPQLDHVVAERARLFSPRMIAVDYAGQPADYAALRELARAHGLYLIADACHAPGGSFRGRSVGTLGDISCFSFHPVKHLTTCEGGMCVTDDADLATHMRRFRNHGIDSDHARREQTGTFRYDMVELGYNYRLPDVQCALGLAQLRRLPDWLAARRTVADAYARAFAKIPQARPLGVRDDREHAWHLYVVRLADHLDRDRAFAALRAQRIGANVHYTPVHLLAFYRARGYGPGLCPVAEREADRVLTLPMFVGMDERDVERVAGAVARLQ